MRPFTYVSVDSQYAALAAGEAFLAGGTTVLDLMKLGVLNPPQLVDINRLPLDKIESLPDGGVRVGAMVRNSELAHHPLIEKNYPLLSQAILSGASPQLRNMATTGGNLMQRTRCYYYRDPTFACNQRTPGSGCAALKGYNRIHAILGVSEQCIATHPSDMCVALSALDATVYVQAKDSGERRVSFEDFHVAYGQDPAKQTILQPGELITAVELPPPGFFSRSVYLKVRDRAQYEFALASAAVALDLDGGVIKESRIALGGVATKPWRARHAEGVLNGKPASDALYAAAADAELTSAVPRTYNAFKVILCKRTIIRALQMAAAVA